MPTIIPIECKFGPTSAYAYFIAAEKPALIDTGVRGSATKEIQEVLAQNGYHIEDIEYILLTHAHVDHIGGAYDVWQATNEQATVVISHNEAYLALDRENHVVDYDALQGQYVDAQRQQQHKEMLLADIGDSFPIVQQVADGAIIDLGSDVKLRVVHTPGHSIGSVTYVLERERYAFCADAVQIAGGAKSSIPAIEFPALYRKSITRLLEEVQPTRLYAGHRFKDAHGVYDAVIDGEDVTRALHASLATDDHLQQLAKAHVTRRGHSKEGIYAPFQEIAENLQYTADPRHLPCAFFVTMRGYVAEYLEIQQRKVIST